MGRFKNRLLASILTRFPALFDRSVEKTGRVEVAGVPWTPFTKDLRECRVALVTTAGVHLKIQRPFDMDNPEGDASFRELPSGTPIDGYMITHDYYGHRDADRDLNIVFPVERLKEMQASGAIGSLAEVNYGFMGHIAGGEVDVLVSKSAPEVAGLLKAQRVDAVLLTPG